MNNKKHIANDIVVFFRSFRYSTLLGIATVLILYFGIYKAHQCFDPDVTYARVECDGDGINYIGNCRIYCDRFLYKVRNHYYSHGLTSTYALQSEIKECCKYWIRDRLIHSSIFGLAGFILLPIAIVTGRIISRGISKGKNWVAENRTIE